MRRLRAGVFLPLLSALLAACTLWSLLRLDAGLSESAPLAPTSRPSEPPRAWPPPCSNLGFGPLGIRGFDRFYLQNESNPVPPGPPAPALNARHFFMPGSVLYPVLRDAFVLNSSFFAILNMKSCYNKVTSWSCRFATARGAQLVESSAFPSDPARHTHVVRCALPLGEEITNVSIFHDSSGHRVVYSDIPACAVPVRPREEALGLCTMTELETGVTSLNMIREWGAMHSLQGFSRAVLYLNSNVTEISSALRDPFFDIVAWDHRLAPHRFYDQQVQQVSCNLRSIGRFKWLALNDVDEIMMRANHSKPILSVLEAFQDSVAGVRLCSKYFGTSAFPVDQARGLGFNYSRATSWPCSKKRGKLIVRPARVNYISVHEITSVTEARFKRYPTVAEDVAFMAHLRSDRCLSCMPDSRVAAWWPDVQAWLQGRSALGA